MVVVGCLGFEVKELFRLCLCGGEAEEARTGKGIFGGPQGIVQLSRMSGIKTFRLQVDHGFQALRPSGFSEFGELGALAPPAFCARSWRFQSAP